MPANLSVIVPYHNEEKVLTQTLDGLARQTFKPKKVILVDSSSTDGSKALVDHWILANQARYETQFINLSEGTDTPGSSKNVGIRHSQTEWVAFMDCGLEFEDDWLDKQLEFARKHELEVVTGMVFMTGEGVIDRCVSAQTYGYKRLRTCVPGSAVKGRVFEKTGLFLENRRAGYDMGWLHLLGPLGIPSAGNPDCQVRYRGVHYATSLPAVFRKSRIYAAPTVGMAHYYTPYCYLGLFLAVSATTVMEPRLSAVYAALYLVLRGYLVPALKSRGLRVVLDDPRSALLLPVVGFTWDLGRLLGITAGFWRYHILRLK